MTKNETEIYENIKASNEHLPQTLATLEEKMETKGLDNHQNRKYIPEDPWTTTDQELSPLTVNFRGKWLVNYIKQLIIFRKTAREKKSSEKAIRKTIPEVKKNWILFCQATGHPELEDKWEDIYKIIPKITEE